MKRGISFVALAIAIAVLTIFAAAIVFNTDYVFVNTEISKLQIDISQIEALMRIYKIRNNGNINFSTVQFNTANLSEAELEQFGGENIIDNNIQLYIIDLEAIDAESSNYGNLKLGSKDRYLYSLTTGKVYYELGIKEDDIIYYTLIEGKKNNNDDNNSTSAVFIPSRVGYTNKAVMVTVELPYTCSNVSITTTNSQIAIGERSVNGSIAQYVVNTSGIVGNYTVTVVYNDGAEKNTAKYDVNSYDITKPVISSITEANFETVNKTPYVKNITATDEHGIKQLKYAEGEISKNTAKEYFKANGNNVIDGKINISSVDKYTLYAEDNAGNFTVYTFDKMYWNYAIYAAADNSLTFIRSDIKITKGETYNNKEITEVYTGFDTAKYTTQTEVPWYNNRTNIKSVKVEGKISPLSTAYWFYELTNCSKLEMEKLDTSNVTNMTYMFAYTGNSTNVTNFKITGMDNWNTTKVINMASLFREAGKNATEWSIGDLSKWNTSMLGDMSNMFQEAGYSAREFNIGQLDNWDISRVKSMYYTFRNAGYSADKFDIGNLDNWNTSQVLSMQMTFHSAGYKASEWNIGNLNKWNTSQVNNMEFMFSYCAYSSSEFNIGQLDNWDTSNVTSMRSMFNYAGKNSNKWNIGNLDNWNVSNVENMENMFSGAGFNASEFNIGKLTKWKTGKVTTMYGMFSECAYKNAIEFDIGNIGEWDVTKVKSMQLMFYGTGRYKANKWNIGDISGWTTAEVTNMNKMFFYAGWYADYTLDLSGWNVNKVTSYEQFNEGVTSKITPPRFG